MTLSTLEGLVLKREPKDHSCGISENEQLGSVKQQEGPFLTGGSMKGLTHAAYS